MLGKLGIALMVAMLTHVTAVQAQVSDTPSVSFNGFGTAGVVHSDERQADFVSNLFVPQGAGHSNEWSAKVDSRVGLQLTANLTSRLSSVVQVVSEQRYDGSYQPDVEWAYAKFDVTPDFSVRAGRMVLPTLMASEYRKVGYASPWVRPPEEVYRMLPVTHFNGVELSHHSYLSGFTNTLQATYGGTDSKFPGGSEITARDGMTLANTLERGATTLFASYGRYRLTIEALNPFFDAYRQFGPEGEAIADRYDVDGKRVDVLTLGAGYDPGDWFVMGEWAQSNSRTFIGDTRGWYATGGYRFGNVTPYLTLARMWVDSPTSDPGVSTAGLPPPYAAHVGGLNHGLNEILGSAAQQKSLSLGARWDFARNMALKVQYDHLDLDAGSPGVLVNRQPGFEPGGSVNLFSLALDFVF